MIGNSGRFRETLPGILGDDPFHRFLRLSDTMYQLAESTWKISLKRIFELLYRIMTGNLEMDPDTVEKLLARDYHRSGQKGQLAFGPPKFKIATHTGVANKRQQKHIDAF